MPAENEAPRQVHRNIKTQLSTERDRKTESERDGEEEQTDLNCCDKLKCLEINCALYPALWILPLATCCSFFLCHFTEHMQHIQPTFFIHYTKNMDDRLKRRPC